jgi:hypothetical protein
MTKKASKALKESIEHWHQILDMLILNYLSDSYLDTDIFMDGHYCPLCVLYSDGGMCWDRCPVYKFTSEDQCVDTPYYEAREWLRCAKHIDEDIYAEGYKLIATELAFLYKVLNGDSE